MALSSNQILLLCAVGILLFASPAHAFGAGNIGSTSKIEGQNWRHGDLEDTLLTLVASKAMGGKKFTKLDVKRVYFGNWLRDYSQAVDVGTVKSVSAEAIRLVLWILGFLSFGYGSKEFEVTTERLGCYRPEEHIDNPKDYADNQDARQYDRRLRGPVDERKELAVNSETGLKNYIASENMGIDTSAGLVRKLFRRSIELGRQYARNKNKADLHEALRLLGTGCHCLEDFAAHSNYVELALIELGERDTFPHVGRRTQMRLRGARDEVYPLVTGTFGGVDFLHSVCGEFDDKATQSEIQELEGQMMQAQSGRQDGSVLQDLLNKVPSGIFGDKDEAGKMQQIQQNANTHQMQNTKISPRQPEEWTRYLEDAKKQIYPVIEWHDEVMQSITETVERIPLLPTLIDSIQDEINKFVFSIIAPYMVPIIRQIKNELNTGSNEIIQTSKNQQHVVFKDDNSTDPTHSMLSKDHFSNVLNEVAGKVASQTVKWIVPQLIQAWDDERANVDQVLNRIIHGVLHHPAQRGEGPDNSSEGRRLMFEVVEKWWREKDNREKSDLRDQLSRRGVESGKNHKEGVHDHGHGSNRPLGMTNLHHTQSSYPAAQAIDAVENTFEELSGAANQGRRPGGGYQGGGYQSGNQSGYPGRQQGAGDNISSEIGKTVGAAVGGGALGGILGGVVGEIGKDILGGGLSENKETYQRQSYGRDGSRTETTTQIGQSGNRYGQAQYSRTEEPGGGHHEEYTRYEQRQSGGRIEGETRFEERASHGEYHQETRHYGSGGRNDDNDRPSSGYGRTNQGGHGRRDDDTPSYGRTGGDSSEYGRRNEKRQSGGYGRRDDDNSGGFGRRDDDRQSGYGRRDDDNTSSGYGRRDDNTSSGYGRRDDDNTSSDYGRSQREEHGYGGSSGGGYGSQQDRREERTSGYGGGRQERDEYGSGRSEGYGGGGGRSSGYGGGRQNDDNEYGRGGGGGGGYGHQQQRFGGGGRDDDDNERGGHGRRQHGRDDDDDNDNRGGYGQRRRGGNDDDGQRMPGGFGDDNDNNNRRRY